MNMKYCEIRDDDILQLGGITHHQQDDMAGKSLWELFLEADDMFNKTNYPCILAVCADGIPVYKDWVRHIKNNRHRYKIELHCLTHENHNSFSRERLKKELCLARDMIEDAFEV